MGDDEITAARSRFPWVRVIMTVCLALAWVGSMAFSFTYAVPDSEYGPIADGSGVGYEKVRAWGLAYGCVVVQTIHRTGDIGWQVRRQDVHFRLFALRENVEGSWTVTTSGVSLLCPVACVAAMIPNRRKRGR